MRMVYHLDRAPDEENRKAAKRVQELEWLQGKVERRCEGDRNKLPPRLLRRLQELETEQQEFEKEYA